MDRSMAKSLHTTNDSVCILIDNKYMGWKIGVQKLPFDALIHSDSFNAHRQQYFITIWTNVAVEGKPSQFYGTSLLQTTLNEN